MGFLDKLFKGLGFEGEQKQHKQQKQPEVEKTEKVTFATTGAKYDLAKLEEKKEPKLYEPESQVEVQAVVDALKTEQVIVVDLNKLNQTDYMRGLDFISGAIYYSGGKIQRAGDKKFYLYSSLEK